MKKIICRFKKYRERRRQADTVFKLTRDYNAKWERWVCRYHLYLEKNDYSIKPMLTYPRTRAEMIKTAEHLYAEMHEVFLNSFFDSRNHYDGCRLYLKSLIAFTHHYPLLWFLRFRLRV